LNECSQGAKTAQVDPHLFWTLALFLGVDCGLQLSPTKVQNIGRWSGEYKALDQADIFKDGLEDELTDGNHHELLVFLSGLPVTDETLSRSTTTSPLLNTMNCAKIAETPVEVFSF
jgi:hypothetical protein